MKNRIRKVVCMLLSICMCLFLTACGSGGGYGVKAVMTLVDQEYSLAFRNDDPIAYYVIGAIQALTDEGKMDELAVKWFGQRVISFPKTEIRLENMPEPGYREFIIGVDINSFPLAYAANGEYWGFDVEFAVAVAQKLGWHIKMQSIEKENVYIELSSGNIDCAWGGLALDPDEETVVVSAIPAGFTEKNDTVTVTAENLNLRSSPSSESKDTIVTAVSKGTQLKRVAVSSDGSWALVEYEGNQLYASMKYLSE